MPLIGRIASGPYHTGKYIQSGGNVFKWLGHVARWLFPAVSTTLSKAAKSESGKKIIKTAQDVALKGALNAGTKIMKGESPKDVLKQSGKEAGKKLGKTLKKEAHRLGQKFLDKHKPIDSDSDSEDAPVKKSKKARKRKLTVAAAPSYSKKAKLGKAPRHLI